MTPPQNQVEAFFSLQERNSMCGATDVRGKAVVEVLSPAEQRSRHVELSEQLLRDVPMSPPKRIKSATSSAVEKEHSDDDSDEHQHFGATATTLVPWTAAPGKRACPLGTCNFNGGCDSWCSSECAGMTCDPDNCTCTYGCRIDPFTMTGQYWGNQCGQQCSPNCLANDGLSQGGCRQSDGACPYGCKSGFWGQNCTVTCACDSGKDNIGCTQADGHCYCAMTTEGGFWNYPVCDKKCPQHCSDGFITCHPRTGNCLHGCGGATKLFEYFWGNQCQNQCSGCLQGCDRETGRCTCSPGYYAPPMCIGRCSNCNECDEHSGECITCSKHTWGFPRCDKPCPYNCVNSSDLSLVFEPSCDQHTGFCRQCNNEQGYWGATCEQACPSSCLPKPACDIHTGTCIMGCAMGYGGSSLVWGPTCSLLCDSTRCLWCHQKTGGCGVCNNGRYLYNCTGRCSPNCQQSVTGDFCDRWTGLCMSDCADGWWGKEHCERRCGNCNRCNATTGVCITPCTGSAGQYCGSMCTEVCGSVNTAALIGLAAVGVGVIVLVLWLWGRYDEKVAAERALLEDAQVGLGDDDDDDDDDDALQIERPAQDDSATNYRAVAEV